MNFYKSVGGKLTVYLLLLLIFGLTLLTSAGIYMAKNSQNSNLEARLEMLASSTITSLEDIMITGNANIVHDWIKGIKKVKGITAIQVLRKDGVEAFFDNDTIGHVNEFLESDEFDPRSQSEMEDAEAEADFSKESVNKAKLAEIVSKRGSVFYKEKLQNNQVLTIMVPILLKEGCLVCHGYDTDPVRGILRLSIPTDQMEHSILVQKEGLIAISIATILVVLMGLYFLVSRMITIPIRKICDGIKMTSEGDMTVHIEVNSDDELGVLTNDFNGMVEKLNKKSKTINVLAKTSTASASVLEELSEELAIDVKRQLTQTEQIATATEELSVSVKEVEKNGNIANKSSGDVLAAATNGKKEIEKAIREARTIENSSKVSVEIIKTLGVRSRDIGQVLAVIMDITDQTNLLALNAAIEAARAGEQGRGFAVVADEVRKLAERTMGATRNIADTIESIQGDTKKAVEQISTVSSQATQGLKISEMAGATYGEIIGKIDTTATMIARMAIATKEQALVAEEIARKVTSVNSIAVESSENATLAAQALKEVEDSIIQIFKELSDYKLK